VEQRCSIVEGNFFESVPDGADAYLLRHIIHDWTDEQSVQILRNCRKVMPSEGKLLIVEAVVPGQRTLSCEELRYGDAGISRWPRANRRRIPASLRTGRLPAHFGDSDRLVGKCRRRQTNLETEDIGVGKHPDLAAFFRSLVRYREPEDSKLVGALCQAPGYLAGLAWILAGSLDTRRPRQLLQFRLYNFLECSPRVHGTAMWPLLLVQVQTVAAIEREFVVCRVVDFASRTAAEFPKPQLVFRVATGRVMEADIWCGSEIVRV
jgi:hypothetical protein